MRLAFFLISIFLSPTTFVLAADFATTTTTTVPSKITFTINGQREEFSAKQVDAWLTPEPFFSLSTASAEIENPLFCRANDPIICGFENSLSLNHHFRLRHSQKFNRDSIKNSLQTWAAKHNRPAQNARFALAENGKVSAFSQNSTGWELKIPENVDLISQELTKNSAASLELTLLGQEIQPTTTTSDADNLGITDLLGEGKSNFKGSPRNRIFNIKVATERFNGILIKPGAEFSFVTILGEVDDKHGYLPELVIKKDKTEPEFGGGICQVSTTVFRAAIYSGLEITARRNHAYPVSYYAPHGMDSTVYVPKPDLKFKNNTPGYILIQAKIVGTELTFQFYGTTDGRKVEVGDPTITERQPDGSMKTFFTQKVFNKDGQVLLDEVFKSSYESPHKFPHPGDAMLAAKPANWTAAEWDAYKNAYYEVNPPLKKKKR